MNTKFLVVVLLLFLVVATLAPDCRRRRRRRCFDYRRRSSSSRRRSPPVQRARFTYCPGNLATQYIESRRTYNRRVYWSMPRATASVKQVLPNSWSGSGTYFRTGRHTIKYQTRNSAGVSYCTFTFVVAARQCSSLGRPSYGSISCSHGNIYGSRCTYSCNPGYYLSGGTTRECIKSGSSTMYWSSSAATCTARRCQPVLSNIPHGSVSCTNSNVQGSVCTHTCVTSGYVIAGHAVVTCTGPSYTSSSTTGSWSAQQPTCIDAEKPKFSSCPSQVVVSADEKKTDAVATWQIPQVTDNSGESISLVLEKGDPPTSRFNNGYTVVRYFATDSAGNIAQCTFTVFVQVTTCVIFPTIPHLNITCDAGYTFGSQCTFRCNDGYNLIGSLQTKCNSQGQWTAMPPECQAVQCPVLTPPINGQFLDAVECDIYFPITCYFECNTGYDLVGNSAVSCTANKTWSDEIPQCKIKTCPRPATTTGMIISNNTNCQINSESLHYNSTCHYSCSQGYYLEGPSSVSCGPQGEWMPSLPICKDVTCESDSLPDPINGVKSCSGSKLYGDTCSLSCNYGYLPSTPVIRTCTDKGGGIGVWNNGTLTCDIVKCDPLPAPLHGQVTTCTYEGQDVDIDERQKYESVCVAECNLGYTGNGTFSRTCLANGQWSNSLLQCQDLTPPELSCPGDRSYIAGYGQIKVTQPWNDWEPVLAMDAGIQFPAEVIQVDNVQLNGSRPTQFTEGNHILTYEATDDADLSTKCTFQVTVRVTKCTGLTPPINGIVELSSGHGSCENNVAYGSLCEASCDVGHYLSSNQSSMECTRDSDTTLVGTWSGTMPECLPVICALPFVTNGYIVGCDLEVEYSTACQFKCNLGFSTTNGEIYSTRQCQADGTFGDFQCDVAVTCPGPLSLNNGVVSPAVCSNDTTIPYDTLCHLTCKSGFEQSGAFNRHCTETGIWHDLTDTVCTDVESPKFNVTCPQYITVESDVGKTSAYVLFEAPSATDNSNSVTVSRQLAHKGPGDVFDEGQTTVTYTATDPSGNFAQCSVIVTVQVYRCPALPSPTGGQTQCSGLILGQNCTISCHEGYELLGPSERVCLRNETTRSMYWDGSSAICQIVKCDALASPQNGLKSGCLNAPPLQENYGTICTLYCNYGYESAGPSQSLCQADGTWSADNFTCSAVRCEALKAVNGINITPSSCMANPTYGHTCTSHCAQQGYTLEPAGREIVTCLASGQWSSDHSNLTCVDKEAPTFTDCPDDVVAFADRASQSTVVHWNVTAEDNDGVVPTVTCNNPPGSNFISGDHTLVCTATDQSQNQNRCTFQVSVQVRQCLSLAVPAYANVVGTCDTSYGSSCTVECQTGYRLLGSNNFTCEYNGNAMYWYTVQQPSCQVIECQPLTLPEKVHVAPIGCGGPGGVQRGTECQFYCLNSFTLIGNDTTSVTCQDSGTWNRDIGTDHLSCTDEESPRISSCPTSIHATLVDVSGVEVTFTEPSATDNSGQAPTLAKSPADVTSPYIVTNDTTVVYRFCDASQNCDDCTFMIYVTDDLEPLVIYCPENQTLITTTQMTVVNLTEPIFGDPRGGSLNIIKPYGGASQTSLPASTHTIHYLAVKPENGKTASCTYYITLQLEVQTCSPLRSPADGGLACDNLPTGTEFCSMFCNENYDIPRTSPPVPEQYVCGSEGWQSENVPDCSATRNSRRSNLPNELMYYTNACPDSTEEIKDAFLKMLRDSNFQSVCDAADRCTVGNVEVTCGECTTCSRRKRDVNNTRWKNARFTNDKNVKKKRSAWQYELLIQFRFEIDVHQTHTDSFDNVIDAENKMLVMLDQMQAEIDNGGFQLPATDGYQYQIIPDSLYAAYAEIYCDDGYTANNDIYICVACTTGTRFVNETKECLFCEKGYYQEQQAQSECVRCPAGTSTLTEGTVNGTDCLPQCRPGSYSHTGVETCQSCPIGFYQNIAGQTTCKVCPDGTSTNGQGKNASVECREPCQAGTYSSDGLKPCFPCPRRYYQPSTGRRQCILCGGSNTTIAEGSTSIQDCFEVNECQSAPCQNEGTCQDLIDSYHCLCKEGFYGINCEINIDDCQSTPCLNNGTCYDGVANLSCDCKPGFAGDDCSVDINECDSSPCHNGGICQDEVDGYLCQCLADFYGDNCEHEVDLCQSSPCVNGASCHQSNGYWCICVPGFTGTHCQINIDDCRNNPCKNQGVCEDGINSYTCECTPGYTGNTCEGKIDLCATTPCFNNATCVDLGNTVSCLCPLGKTDSKCESDFTEMDNPCENGATLTILPVGIACTCVNGFVGQYCEIDFDDCASSPCSNGATCVDGIATYECICPPGFQGSICGEDMDECSSNPCEDGSTCIDNINGYTCRCKEGFTGEHCEEMINPCDQLPCANNATCTASTNGSFSCHCPAGFKGLDCGININECLSQPCLNGGYCVDGVNEYSCECVTGFEGRKCEVDIDDCSQTSCLNGGTCHDGINSYICTCAEYYTGIHCETPIDFCSSGPCQNGGVCQSQIGSYLCSCASGFAGPVCQININECASNPCSNAYSCTDGVADYTCDCESGWTGKNCDEPFSACSSLPCQNNGYCYDISSSYICLCKVGFQGDNCEVDIDDCIGHKCKNGATCSDGVNGYTCQCPYLYRGKFCQIQSVDYCSPNPCKNNGQCLNSATDYTCSCLSGFQGLDCEIDVDDCISNNCQNGATCVDLINRYNCRCMAGYVGQYCHINVNECESLPCQNGATCEDLVNGYSCACSPGFQGTHCHINVDECTPNPCENGASCMDGTNDFTCLCVAGYSGKTCDVNIDECWSTPCVNDATCVDGINEYSCECPPGYAGRHCEEVIAADYDFKFVNSTLTDHVTAEVTSLQPITSFTLAFWMRTSGGAFNLQLEYQSNGTSSFLVAVTESGIVVAINGTH